VERAGKIRRILIWILFLNLFVSIAKLFLGYFTSTASVLADGFHSLSDAGGNVVALIGITIAAKPRDADHHYGHRKYETIAAMVIAMFLAIVAFELLKSAIDRLLHPVFPQVNLISFAVMLGTLAINIGVTIYERKRGKELGSEILIADSHHTQSDVLTTISVLVALVAIGAGFPIMDTLVTLLIVGFIGYAAFNIFFESAKILGDTAIPIVGEVEAIIREIPEVHDFHNIRTTGHPDEARVDMHVGFDPKLSNAECHEITHRIENRIKERIHSVKEVMIHVEPETGRC